MNVQFKKGALELIVLLIIKKEDQYGYSLVQNISRYMTIAEGTVYPLLRRLVKSGELSTYQQGAARVNQLEEDWKLFTEAVEHFIEESENE